MGIRVGVGFGERWSDKASGGVQKETNLGSLKQHLMHGYVRYRRRRLRVGGTTAGTHGHVYTLLTHYSFDTQVVT